MTAESQDAAEYLSPVSDNLLITLVLLND